MTTDESDRRSIDEVMAAAEARLDRVDATDLAAEASAGALVVDIRPIELRERHGALPGALVIDRNVLEWRLDPKSSDRIPQASDYDRRIVLVCHEGYASVLAACSLRDLGLHRATDLAGGYQAWASVSHSSSGQNSKPASSA